MDLYEEEDLPTEKGNSITNSYHMVKKLNSQQTQKWH